MAKTERSLDMPARSAERQTPGEIVGRLISLSLGLFMVLGTCTLL